MFILLCILVAAVEWYILLQAYQPFLVPAYQRARFSSFSQELGFVQCTNTWAQGTQAGITEHSLSSGLNGHRFGHRKAHGAAVYEHSLWVPLQPRPELQTMERGSGGVGGLGRGAAPVRTVWGSA